MGFQLYNLIFANDGTTLKEGLKPNTRTTYGKGLGKDYCGSNGVEGPVEIYRPEYLIQSAEEKFHITAGPYCLHML